MAAAPMASIVVWMKKPALMVSRFVGRSEAERACRVPKTTTFQLSRDEDSRTGSLIAVKRSDGATLSVMDEVVGPPDGGRCAGPKPGRQRRRQGGRVHVVKVRLDDVEAAELARRAEKAGVSGPRFLVEAALVGDRQTVSERRALVTTLMAAKRQLAGVANNLNQLTRVANSTQRIPGEIPDALQRVARAADHLEDVAAQVAASRR